MSEQQEIANCHIHGNYYSGYTRCPTCADLETIYTKPNDDPPAPQAACIHAQLQMQLVVPEECLVRGDIGAWYKCQRCGEQFRTDLKEYKLVVTTDAPQAAVDLGAAGLAGEE